MNRKKKLDKRNKILLFLLAICLVAYCVKMLDLQVVNAARYASQGDNDYTRRVVVKAARGEILDCYGRPIAINRTGYNVVFNRAYMKSNQINKNIVNLIGYFTKANIGWIDNLPMQSTPSPAFTDDETAVAKMKKLLKVNHYASAQDCFDTMVERYELQGMTLETQRRLMGVRYTMESQDFSISNPYTFAEDIPAELMLTISEASINLFHGIETQVVPVRVYPDGTLAAHLIGTVSKMNAEDWKDKKDKGYSYNDKIGKGGIEEAYEEYLHGTDGEIRYTFDSNGEIIKTEVTKEPIQGNTVILTIDANLQKLAQNALEETYNTFNSEGASISGASAVVLNVNTGQVLTAANYPSYDLNTYSQDISNLVADSKGAPLTNRAFCGTYQPGSTFKPATAIAALTNSAVTIDEQIKCTGVYTYFKNYPHRCMHYHGSIRIQTAISKSCNYFFYEVGRRTGITKMNAICRKFGLGEKTGVEVEEKAGILAGPDYVKSINGVWYEGNTIQAAIGQSYNMFTPVQLANYTATIANGGTRYKTTLLKEVKDYSLTEVIYANEPQVAEKTDVSSNVLSTVKEGMLSVTEEGTARAYFADYPIKVGGKTGTAQNNGPDHSVFIAFAPFENPEIALAVVFEHGETSRTTGSVAKKILDQYFYSSFEKYTDETANTILP